MRTQTQLRGTRERYTGHRRARTVLVCLAAIVLAASRSTGGQPLVNVPAAAQPRMEPASGIELRKLVEEDWLKSLIEPVTTQSDAAGAVDGGE